jgi:hypothetical protein
MIKSFLTPSILIEFYSRTGTGGLSTGSILWRLFSMHCIIMAWISCFLNY